MACLAVCGCKSTAQEYVDEHSGGNFYVRGQIQNLDGMTTDTWVKVQGGRSEGLVADTQRSVDGGFEFVGTDPGTLDDAEVIRWDAFPSGHVAIETVACVLALKYHRPGLRPQLRTEASPVFQYPNHAPPLWERSHRSYHGSLHGQRVAWRQ